MEPEAVFGGGPGGGAVAPPGSSRGSGGRQPPGQAQEALLPFCCYPSSHSRLFAEMPVCVSGPGSPEGSKGGSVFFNLSRLHGGRNLQAARRRP
eukprot:1635313-Alexandrium_andersonii.AAC.1